VAGDREADAAPCEVLVQVDERIGDLAVSAGSRLGRTGADDPVARLDGADPPGLEEDRPAPRGGGFPGGQLPPIVRTPPRRVELSASLR
jgi:hypothetical protein